MDEAPQNALYERYASREMGALFSAEHRYRLWRRVWITLAECQSELGLPISGEQLAALRDAAPHFDLQRVAEIESQTRHDVVAHLRHFAEQAGEAGGILHLGATSAFVTDNADALLLQEGLELLAGRLAAAIEALTDFAGKHRKTPCLAYTHFQPAQLTTVGKRACLWLQDLVMDLEELRLRRRTLRCRGVKGTTGTQASYLTLLDGDPAKVRRLDELFAERLGFDASFPITGQTYPRKQDSRILAALAGIAESCHKFGTDVRLLQGLGEISEPFGTHQVGSSAMAYKRNPIRAERMCSLARRLITDSLNGPLTVATQWLERSLDDSANRRLVLPDAFLTADAVLALAAYIAGGLQVHEEIIATRVSRQLPFMATETLLMQASLRGGDRQELHERLRRYSLAAQEELERGGENTLVDKVVQDPEFRLDRQEVESWLDPVAFTGRAAQQVEDYLQEVVSPLIDSTISVAAESPRV